MATKETVDHLVDLLSTIQDQDKPVFLFNLWERSKKDSAMLQLAIYAIFLNSYHPQYQECDWISQFDGQIHPKVYQNKKNKLNLSSKQLMRILRFQNGLIIAY
jgi:hypothetical protein